MSPRFLKENSNLSTLPLENKQKLSFLPDHFGQGSGVGSRSLSHRKNLFFFEEFSITSSLDWPFFPSSTIQAFSLVSASLVSPVVTQTSYSFKQIRKTSSSSSQPSQAPHFLHFYTNLAAIFYIFYETRPTRTGILNKTSFVFLTHSGLTGLLVEV